MSRRHNQTSPVNLMVSAGLSPSPASLIYKTIRCWVLSSGEEWAVKRLKTFKQLYILHLMNRDSTKDSPLWKDIRSKLINSTTRVPKGPLGHLWSLPHEKLDVVMFVLHYYTFCYGPSDTITKAQRVKSVFPIYQTPEKECKVDIKLSNVCAALGKEIGPCIKVPALDQSFDKEYSISTPGEKRRYRSEYQSVVRYLRKFDQKGFLVDVPSGATMGPYATLFDHTWNRTLLNPNSDFNLEKEDVGYIGCTQEKGYKLRVFAYPFLALQWLMSPLKIWLLSAIRMISADYTHDQQSALPVIQEQLHQSKELYCFDLSNATDTFPRSLTEEIVRLVISQTPNLMDYSKSQMLAVFQHWKRLNRAIYKLPPQIGTGSISWSQGQPLGLGPSFPAFALSHHMVVWAAGHDVGIHMHPRNSHNFYAILGDDICIFDKKLALAYSKRMLELGVHFSESKTLVSNSVAEFAGNLITKLPNGEVHTSVSTKWERKIPQLIWNKAYLFSHTRHLSLTPKELRSFYWWKAFAFSNNPGGIPLERIAAFQEYWKDDQALSQLKGKFSYELTNFESEANQLYDTFPIKPTYRTKLLLRGAENVLLRLNPNQSPHGRRDMWLAALGSKKPFRRLDVYGTYTSDSSLMSEPKSPVMVIPRFGIVRSLDEARRLAKQDRLTYLCSLKSGKHVPKTCLVSSAVFKRRLSKFVLKWESVNQILHGQTQEST